MQAARKRQEEAIRKRQEEMKTRGERTGSDGGAGVPPHLSNRGSIETFPAGGRQMTKASGRLPAPPQPAAAGFGVDSELAAKLARRHQGSRDDLVDSLQAGLANGIPLRQISFQRGKPKMRVKG